MFTGLVQSIGTIIDSQPTAAGRCLTVELGTLDPVHHVVGQSIAVNGVCLTVAEKLAPTAVAFDVISETLRRTTLGHLPPETKVNLEGALRAGEPFGGHFVQGHIDAVGEVRHVKPDAKDWRITIAMPPEAAPMIVNKGSVAVEGVSMTVAGRGDDEFELAVIPTTLQATTLGALRPGDKVNLETDILARTIWNYLQNMRLYSDVHNGLQMPAVTGAGR
jgi:riboflavin synthase